MASLLQRLAVYLILPVACWLASPAAMAETANHAIGIVLMHGKGGSPTKFISDLAGPLEREGFLVANLEMPWSERRSYDVSVQAADAEVDAALKALRDKGARKVFVAGHSQGGLFALHYGDAHAVGGIIAIAPGGNVASPIYNEKLGQYLDNARKLVADGKGDEKTQLGDFESSKGAYPITVTPAIYLGWFDPDGAMNQIKAEQSLNPATPVLFVAPTKDYPGLAKVKQQMFGALPKNPLTRLYEPDSTHLGAPGASVKAVIGWIGEVVGAQ